MAPNREQAQLAQRASVTKRMRNRANMQRQHAIAWELVDTFGEEGIGVAAAGASMALALQIAERAASVPCETPQDVGELAKALRHTYTVWRLHSGASTANNETHVVVQSDDYASRVADAEARLAALRSNTVAIPPPSPAP